MARMMTTGAQYGPDGQIITPPVGRPAKAPAKRKRSIAAPASPAKAPAKRKRSDAAPAKALAKAPAKAPAKRKRSNAVPDAPTKAPAKAPAKRKRSGAAPASPAKPPAKAPAKRKRSDAVPAAPAKPPAKAPAKRKRSEAGPPVRAAQGAKRRAAPGGAEREPAPAKRARTARAEEPDLAALPPVSHPSHLKARDLAVAAAPDAPALAAPPPAPHPPRQRALASAATATAPAAPCEAFGRAGASPGPFAPCGLLLGGVPPGPAARAPLWPTVSASTSAASIIHSPGMHTERPFREALGPAPRAPQRAAQGRPPHPLPLTRPAPRQEPGDVFVLGDGDCGQFGKGEDVTEALRPTPSPLPEGAGQARRAALPAGCMPRGRSFRAVRMCASSPALSSACGSCAIDAAEVPAGTAAPRLFPRLAVSMGSGAAGRRWCRWPQAACTARR